MTQAQASETPEQTRYTAAQWLEEGKRRFGAETAQWRFVCPSCGHVASVKDWQDAGAEEGEVAFSCVGRHLPNPRHLGGKPGPCNYAGGGLFQLNPIYVMHEDGVESRMFAFAPA